MSSSQAKSASAATDVAWSAATDRGERPRNQDRFGATRAGQATVLAVCDGLGGHRAGEVAAEHAVRRFLAEATLAGGTGPLEPMVMGISQEILQMGQSRPALEGLGTTVAALRIAGGIASFVAVGDSRIYLLRGGRLGLLAEPHELTRILMREGVLSEEELGTSPIRGRVTAYLGQEQPEICSGAVPVRVSDRFALVTDGVLEGGESRLYEILFGPCPETAARTLVHGIRTEDNATAVVAHIKSVEGPCLAS